MAMDEQRVVSIRFPYVPVRLRLQQDHTSGQEANLDALVDTGFDGDVVVPPDVVTGGAPPAVYLPWILADGSEVVAPAYLGILWLGGLDPIDVLVTVLGDEPIVGRSVTNHFTVVLDHGQRLVVEP
jgi:predicted aspartyl protease